MRRLTLAFVATLCAAPLPAQHLTLGLAGGTSLAATAVDDGRSTGWHGLLFVGLERTMQPLALRLDLAHSRSSFDVGTAPEQTSTERAVSSATLNLTYRLPAAGSSFSPYVIAGLGAYHAECEEDIACDGATRRGWNAGLGTRVRVAGVRLFAEARYHDSGTAEYLPITLGFTL
jgi:hypothetical protein